MGKLLTAMVEAELILTIEKGELKILKNRNMMTREDVIKILESLPPVKYGDLDGKN